MSRALLPVLLLAGCWIGPAERDAREQWWFELSAGFQTTCGLRGSGSIACWGEIVEEPPGGEFEQVSGGYQHACGLRGGEIACWGNEGSPAILAPPAGDDWVQVSTLAFDACGVDDEGDLACWGNTASVLDTPPGAFAAVAVGEVFACALGSDDGEIACWGQDDQGETSPPPGAFRTVDVGDDHACALDLAGAMECWGEADWTSLLGGDWTDLAVGWDFACGLDGDGAVTCRDQGNAETLQAPGDDVFVSIDAGSSYVCGIADDGRAVCWGSNDQGEIDVPSNPAADR